MRAEGVELALQGVEAGALGAVGELAAGRVYGLGQGLAIVLLTQGLQQFAHEVVDGGTVLLAIGVIDAQSLEQALDCGGRLLRRLLSRLGLGTAAQQLAAQFESDRGDGKQGADNDVTLRYG